VALNGVCSRLTTALCLAAVAAGGIACANSPPVPPARPVSLRWVSSASAPAHAWVEAKGLDTGAMGHGIFVKGDRMLAAQTLRVYSLPADRAAVVPDPSMPPMLGLYEAADGILTFRPRFPLEPGVRYVAVLTPGKFHDPRVINPGALTAAYTPPPRPDAPPTVVSRVYPTADTVPENLLKFYVHFSAPMSRGGVYRHVRLLDASGAAVELPFLELDEELWDPEMTRLTLFIDPGRIKRGVRPLEEIGPALEAGKRYTLVIDRGAVDAGGRDLGEEYRKSFTVAPPDREPPDPATWRVTAPRASTRAPVVIEFSDPMDHALAERLIRVTALGRVVPGAVSVGGAERRWTFTPDQPWPAGRYDIVVQPTIEDLAGNNIGKPFEVDMEAPDTAPPEMKPVLLPFEIR
jgi:hypothetical protein